MSNQLKFRTSKVCVNNRFVGLAATHEQAERMAQAYVANGETIKRQNRAVMKAESADKIVAPREERQKEV